MSSRTPTSCKPFPMPLVWPPESISEGCPCPLPMTTWASDAALTQQHPQSGGPGAQGVLLHLDAVQHLGAVRLPAGEAPLQRLGTCCYIHGTRGAPWAPPARVLARPPACPLAAAAAPEPGRRGPRGVGAAAGAAGRPRRAWSADALAPGPGVVRAGGPGRCSPRRVLPGTRSHARRLLCHLLVSPGAGLRRRQQTEPRGGGGGGGSGGGGGGGRGRGRGCRGGPAAWGGAGGAAGSRAGRSGPQGSRRAPRTTPVPWCARGAAGFRAGAGGGGILRPGAASPLLKLPDI